MKKVAFFQPNNNFSGSCRVLHQVITDEYEDCDYIVVTTGIDGLLSSLPSDKIRILSYPTFNGKIIHGLSYIIYIIKLFIVSLLIGFKYRVFYINTIIPYPAVIAGKIMGCETIFHVHEKFHKSTKITNKIGCYVFKHSKAKRIYVSKYLQEAYHDTDSTSVVKYNKLTKEFIGKVRVVPFKKRKLNTILMVTAKASKEKGVDLFYELASSKPELNFILATEMPTGYVYKFLQKPVIPNLNVCQGKGNINACYEMADILINLSNKRYFVETFGLTLIEGMAYGLPIIAPNIGGPKEIVQNGYNGILIDDIEDVKGIAETIDIVLNKKNYFEMAEHSIELSQKYK